MSFLVIGLYWQGHHRMFRLINRFDDRLVWINLLFLLCIVVIPFPTTVLGEHANAPAAVILYAGVLALTGLLQAAMWLYATHRRRLVDTTLERKPVPAPGARRHRAHAGRAAGIPGVDGAAHRLARLGEVQLDPDRAGARPDELDRPQDSGRRRTEVN